MSTGHIFSDEQHSVPIQQMGNYQEHLKKQPSPLRELENTPSRVHMFGNPFKVNKVGALIIRNPVFNQARLKPISVATQTS